MPISHNVTIEYTIKIERGLDMSNKNVLWEIEPLIVLVNTGLDEQLDIDIHKKLRDAMRYYPMAGGKRLRPILAMVAAEAISGSEKSKKAALPLGLALEITHNFTLIHDDLMDKDLIRRGVPSVHAKFGEDTAINAGDALFARAFEVLSSTDLNVKAFKRLLNSFSVMVRGIAEGQQMDMDFEGRLDITEEEYLIMVEKKTALMFQVAAEGGALIGGGTEEQIEKLSEYGRLLGIGFQIWDDLLDLEGDQEKIGKPVGSDIKNGKRTLIVVRALDTLQGADRERFLQILGNEDATDADIKDAMDILNRVGAIDYTKKAALDYADRSKKLLDILPDSPSKNILLDNVDYLVSRDT